MIVETTAKNLTELLGLRGVALGRTGDEELEIAGMGRQTGFYNFMLQNNGTGTVNIQNFDSTFLVAGNLNFISLAPGEKIILSLRSLKQCFLVADVNTEVGVLYN